MGSSVLGVPYEAGYMWGVVCLGYPMDSRNEITMIFIGGTVTTQHSTT